MEVNDVDVDVAADLCAPVCLHIDEDVVARLCWPNIHVACHNYFYFTKIIM